MYMFSVMENCLKKKLLATASVQEVWTYKQEVGKCKFIGHLYLCPRSFVVSTHSHKPLLDPKTPRNQNPGFQP